MADFELLKASALTDSLASADDAAKQALAAAGIDSDFISEDTTDPPDASTDGTKGAKRKADGSWQRLEWNSNTSSWDEVGAPLASRNTDGEVLDPNFRATTISDLRSNETPTANKIVAVDKAVSGGAEMNALYRWIDGDTTAQDGGVVLESKVSGYAPGDANEGRWKLIWHGHEVSARLWGAIGDGSSHTLDNYFGSVSDAQEIYGSTVVPDGATLSNIEIDWAAIQRAVEVATFTHDCKVSIPGGDFRLSDTIKIGYGDGNNYATVTVSGVSQSYDSTLGTRLYCDFKDRPGINIQGARGVTLRRVGLYGQNTSPGNVTGVDSDVNQYIDSDASSGRYNPYAAITVDAYSGSKPGTAYPNDAYGRSPSAGVKIEECNARRFVVGIAIQPSDNNANGEQIRVVGGVYTRCAYIFSQGNSQGNYNTIENIGTSVSHTAFTNRVHGRQIGDIPEIRSSSITKAYQCFNLDATSADTKTLTNLFSEEVARLGIIGQSSASTYAGVVLSGCTFNFNYTLGEKPTVQLHNFAPVVFLGGKVGIVNASSDLVESIFNITGERGYTEFIGTMVASGANENYKYIGVLEGSSRIVFSRSFPRTNQSTKIENTYRGFVSDRTLIGSQVRRVEYQQNAWRLRFGRPDWTYGASDDFSISSVSFSGSTATISTSNTDHVQVDDLILWQVNVEGTNYRVPALKVTDVNGAGNEVTAEALFDDIDESYSPSSIRVAIRLFIQNTVATGDLTSGSDQVTNVSKPGNFEVGDILNFELTDGISFNTRITAVDENNNTLTLSQNATKTLTGEPLLNVGMIPEPSQQMPKEPSLTENTGAVIDTTIENPGETSDLSGSVGTSDGSLASVSGTGDDSTVNDNFEDIRAKINSIISDLGRARSNDADLTRKVNNIITALQNADIMES